MEVDDFVLVDDDMAVSAFETGSYDYCDDDFSEHSSCGRAEPQVDNCAALYESLIPVEVDCPISSSQMIEANAEFRYEAMRFSEHQVHDWTSHQRASLSMLSENMLESLVPNESELDNVHQEALYLLEKESQESLSNHSRKEDSLTQSRPVSLSGDETSSEDNNMRDNFDEPPVREGSRKCNKKRRRHLKLMRKAAAAAAAAAAISEMTRSASSPGKKKTISSGGRLTKRVANIAVACAAESIASYKAEHLAKGKKAF